MCGGSPQVRPGTLTILCSGNGIAALRLRWSGWGSPVATVTGTAVVNLCEYSDCHNGAYGSFPIVIMLSRLSSCPHGGQAYSRLQYLFVGAQPFPQGNPPLSKAAPQALREAPAGTVPGMPGPGC